jgi:hypothetical protein
MYYRHHSATALVAIVAGVIASTDAQGASRVGGATSVVRDVSGSPSGQSWAKKVEGDDVYENEFIRTEAESSTRISFIDETNIRIGPMATMKIDRVVFKTNRSVSELIVIAEEGAIRWNSGASLSSAYQIKTPDAIIRPSGTTFDLLVESQRTVVVLRRGRIEVCSIDAPQRCQTLSRSGDTIIATPNDLERLQRTGLEPSEFADRCLSANTTAPCVIMASAQPTGSGGVTAPATGRRHANNPPRRTGDSTQTYVTPIVSPPNVEPTPLINVTPIVTPPNVVLIPPYVPKGGKRPNPHDPPYVPPGGKGQNPPDVPPIEKGPKPPDVPPIVTRPIPRDPPYVKRPIPRDVKQIPNNVRPTSVRPTNVRPTNVGPTNVRPTNVRPTNVGPIYAYVRPTMRPTYVRPTVVRPTVRPTFVRPTSPRPTPIK